MSHEIVPGRPQRSGGPVSERPVTSERVSDVGDFRQGSDASQRVLRRYLLTRALGSSIVRTVYATGIAILLAAVLCWLGGLKILAVLIGLVAIVVLIVRAALAAVQRRLSGSDQLGPLEPRVAAMVGRTRRGLRQELRRVGLPGHPWGPLVIALRLIRPLKRARTLQALTRIDLAKVVPASSVDELHVLLRSDPSEFRH